MAVVIETTLGDITVDLFIEERPTTCLNFLKLCKIKYYNFCLFHSVQQNFIAQSGDPSGSGSEGHSIFYHTQGKDSKYFEAEKLPKLKHSNVGVVSMVNCGNNMLGSQFFITLGKDLQSLDGEHCIFGEVSEGHEVLRKFNEVICDQDHRPYQDIRITHTIILEDPFDDPPGLTVPDRSPELSREILANGRIAPDEEIDETAGLTVEEVEELQRTREAQAQATILEIVGDLPDANVAPPENVLFVCKLNPVTTDDDLEIIFSRFGKIVSCEVIRDKNTGDSLQYAFVEFDNKKACEDAYFKMDNVLIDDRRIHVDFSQSVSKMRWKGKGRGVEYFNDKDSSKSERRDKSSDPVVEKDDKGMKDRRQRESNYKRKHNDRRDDRKLIDRRDDRKYSDKRDERKYDTREERKHIDKRDVKKNVDKRDEKKYVDKRDTKKYIDKRDERNEYQRESRKRERSRDKEDRFRKRRVIEHERQTSSGEKHKKSRDQRNTSVDKNSYVSDQQKRRDMKTKRHNEGENHSVKKKSISSRNINKNKKRDKKVRRHHSSSNESRSRSSDSTSSYSSSTTNSSSNSSHSSSSSSSASRSSSTDSTASSSDSSTSRSSSSSYSSSRSSRSTSSDRHIRKKRHHKNERKPKKHIVSRKSVSTSKKKMKKVSVSEISSESPDDSAKKYKKKKKETACITNSENRMNRIKDHKKESIKKLSRSKSNGYGSSNDSNDDYNKKRKSSKRHKKK